MGCDPRSTICYGVKFDPGFEFPWYEKGNEEWWMEVNGANIENPYDGNAYLPGKGPDDGSKYWKEFFKWQKNNPFPFKLVNYCNYDEHMYILALPETAIWCEWGEPLEFNPDDLVVSEERKQSILDFCEKYGIIVESEPQWYLSAFYG